jgi:hypothetical protein
MGTHFQTTACPLCSDRFDDPQEYRDHLAFMHDLVDDEGAETTLDEVPDEPEPEPEPAPEVLVLPRVERVEPVPFVAPVVASASLTGPLDVHVDRRVLPGLVVAVALQLAIAVLGLAVVDDGSAQKVDAAASTRSAAEANGAATPEQADENPRDATATTVPPTTAAPAIDTSNDKARADSFALRASDVPAGWQPSSTDDADEGGDSGPDCSVPGDPTETDALTAETDTAFESENSGVFGGAMMLKTDKDALRAMDVLRQIAPCLGEGVIAGAKESMPAGVNVSHGTFSPLGFPLYGDESVALSMPVTLSGGGMGIPMRVDLLAIRRDRADTFILAVIGANDFTPVQEKAMLSAIADRMSPRAI